MYEDPSKQVSRIPRRSKSKFKSVSVPTYASGVGRVKEGEEDDGEGKSIGERRVTGMLRWKLRRRLELGVGAPARAPITKRKPNPQIIFHFLFHFLE